MNVVHLLLDYAGLIQPKTGDLLIEQVADYAPGYAAITEALHADRKLRAIVRHRACGAWLRHAQAKYGDERIQITETSYRSLVEAHWGVRVPDWVLDRDLVASRLLELPPPQAEPGQAFEELALEAFWGAALAHARLPLGRLAELTNSFDADHWRASGDIPIARAVLQRRLSQWDAVAQRPGETLLIRAIRETPARLAGLLSQLRVLGGYPQEVGIRCLGDDYPRFTELNLDLGALILEAGALREATMQVRIHLQSLPRSGLDAARLESVLDQMSGDLLDEYDWVEGLIRSGQVPASRGLLERVAHVFRPIRHRVAHRLADLELLIEPPRPSEPSSHWDTDGWISWAVREYLPYRFWLEAKGALDEQVATYADAYGDWLFGKFPGLIGHHKQLAYRAIVNLKGELDEDQVLLFVILDNVGFRYAGELRTLMQARGYRSGEPVPYLSMLPSATEVSKKAMAAGDPAGFEGTAYRDVVEHTWGAQFRRDTKYLGRVGDLQALSSHEHGVYVLNYTPIDDALHSDPRSTGLSHSQAVRQAMESLVGAVHDFALRFGIEDVLRVVVCADHGSTLIPSETANVIDAAFIAKRIENVHHRYLALSDKELDALPQSIRDQCYCFRSGVFGLPSSYLAARGYGRFRMGETASFVHGGLTPEETLVPFMSFQRAYVSVRRPNVRLLDSVFRYGVRSRVRLEVVNANELPLQSLRVEIARPQGVAEPCAVDDPIEAGAVGQLVLDDVRFRDVQDDAKEICVILAYECGGQERRDEYVLPVTMRRIMTSSFDLNL